MRAGLRLWLVLASFTGLAGCGAKSVAPGSEGTSVTNGDCGRGLVVVESDYQSTNVSLLGFDGRVLSPSFASSSTAAGGFGVSLGSDVAAPSNRIAGSNLVLIDRYPVGVLRFYDLASATNSAELSVDFGASTNPHDYLPLSATKAYVPRYDENPNAGKQPFDAGGDVLVVDPTGPSITASIDLSPAMAGEAAPFTPHPGRIALVGARVFVLLASYAQDYTSATTSRLVELDPRTDEVFETTLLDGFRGCDGFAVAPDHTELAIACTGADLANTPPNIDAAGIALVDMGAPARITKRFAASTFGSNPIGFSLDYVDQHTLLFGTLGFLASDGKNAASQDAIVQLDLESGNFTQILASVSQPFTLGDVRCASECGACFVADAARAGGSVQRLVVTGPGALGAPQTIRAETKIGLPPRSFGVF